MEVTFGKFKGWQPEALAKTLDGRNYLDWAADNLDSPKWRKEFKRVLSLDFAYDFALSIKATMTANPDLSYEDAEIWVKDTIVSESEANDLVGKFASLETRLRRYLANNGISEKGVGFIMSRLHHIHDLEDLDKMVTGG